MNTTQSNLKAGLTKSITVHGDSAVNIVQITTEVVGGVKLLHMQCIYPRDWRIEFM